MWRQLLGPRIKVCGPLSRARPRLAQRTLGILAGIAKGVAAKSQKQRWVSVDEAAQPKPGAARAAKNGGLERETSNPVQVVRGRAACSLTISGRAGGCRSRKFDAWNVDSSLRGISPATKKISTPEKNILREDSCQVAITIEMALLRGNSRQYPDGVCVVS